MGHLYSLLVIVVQAHQFSLPPFTHTPIDTPTHPPYTLSTQTHTHTHCRFLRFFAVKQPHSLSRVRRQTAGCQNVTDCLPPGVANTNTNFAQCTAGQCVCTDCFMSIDGSRCQICTDYPYDNAQDRCGRDGRPRQLTAFLLSLFLSSTGAANFYIGQNGLGKACL